MSKETVLSNLSACVRATVTVEFSVGSWNAATSFHDLHEQVSREAAQKVRNLMGQGARIIGDPEISVSVFSKEK